MGFGRLLLSSSEALLMFSMSSEVVSALDEEIISLSAKIAAMGCGSSLSSRSALWKASTIEKASGIVGKRWRLSVRSMPSEGAASRPVPASASAADIMRAYRARRNARRTPVLSRYRVMGFLNSGTYGRVYKAQELVPRGSWVREPRVYAIKKFKPDREGHAALYTGISQSAVREIALNRELRHVNVVWLREVLLEENAIFLVYEYVEHDFLQIIHHHLTVLRTPIRGAMIKSLLWQVLNGVQYLHENWIMHRDLKPANILITAHGVVKIGDLGLARVYCGPLVSLHTSDMVVVTIWYRAPELLLGARHYSPAIDLWAVGCIWGELIALRPMFKGEEIRMSSKVKTVPLQTCVTLLMQEPAGEDCRHSRHADARALAVDRGAARLCGMASAAAR